MVVVELAEAGLGRRVLGEDAAARDLGDVRRLEVDLLREAVHQPRQLDLLVVEAADDLAELLLGGDDDPVLATPGPSQALDDRLEVEHLLHVTGDELADLVDDEHQGLRHGGGEPSARCSARRGVFGVMSARPLAPFAQESAWG